MAAAKQPSVLERLREPFPASQVKLNQDKKHYVAIDGYINRLLDVLGLDYEFMVTGSSVELLPETMKTSSGKRQYLAQVSGALVIDGHSRAGVGADVSHDPDKALKTAQAEALKKAAHQFGIALELWDEEHRKAIDRQKSLKTPAARKQELFRLAKEALGKDKPTAKEIAEHFGVKAGDLADDGTITRILTEQGAL